MYLRRASKVGRERVAFSPSVKVCGQRDPYFTKGCILDEWNKQTKQYKGVSQLYELLNCGFDRERAQGRQWARAPGGDVFVGLVQVGVLGLRLFTAERRTGAQLLRTHISILFSFLLVAYRYGGMPPGYTRTSHGGG
jgi:hypothetical protein